jgi:hypothetical protein
MPTVRAISTGIGVLVWWSFFSRLPVDGTVVPKFAGFDSCQELHFDIWIFHFIIFLECIDSSLYKTELLYFVSKPNYTQMAWIERFYLLFCKQLMKRFLFKLHLSLPTAIMVLFHSTVSKFLWSIHLICNCVKYFVAVSFSPVLVLFLLYNFLLFPFPRIETVVFHVFHYLNLN